MIVEIQGPGGPEYVALHRDVRTSEPVWVPIRGDRGASGEKYKMLAVEMCVRDLQEWFAPAVKAATQLHKICDRRGPARPSEASEPPICHLARQIADSLRLARANLNRLIDAPHDGDRVEIDADFVPRPRRPRKTRGNGTRRTLK